MALEAARILGDRVVGLTLIEPVSFHLLRPMGYEAEWATVERLADDVVRLVRATKTGRAARRYMSHWIGGLRYLLAPPRIRSEIVRTMPKVAQEFDGMERVDVRPGDYDSVTARTLILVGTRTTRPAKAAAESVRTILPGARLEWIKGAGHMSPMTHREAVCPLIVQHISAAN